MGEATDYDLCSNAFVCIAIKWAVQHLVYSGEVPRLDRLKVVFCDEWDYEFDSLPRHSGGSSSKAG